MYGLHLLRPVHRVALFGFALACAFVDAAPGIVLDTGDVLVVEDGPPDRVVRVEPNGTLTPISVGGGLLDPWAIAVGADRRIYVTGGSSPSTAYVLRIDPEDGSQHPVASGGRLFSPGGIAVDRDGSLLVADGFAMASVGALIRIDPATGVQTVVFASNDPWFDRDPVYSVYGFRPHAVDVAPDGRYAVTCTTFGSQGVVLYDPATRQFERVVAGSPLLYFPSDVVVAAGGDFYVADRGSCPSGVPRVIRIAASTGDPTTVYQTPYNCIDNFTGIDLDAAGDLVVVDPASGDSSLFRIDLPSGVVDASLRNAFVRARDVAVVPEAATPGSALAACAALAMLRRMRRRAHHAG